MYVDKHYKIRPDQAKAFKSIPGNESEHIRAAIDDYLVKMRKLRSQINVSMSPSILTIFKPSEANGSIN